MAAACVVEKSPHQCGSLVQRVVPLRRQELVSYGLIIIPHAMFRVFGRLARLSSVEHPGYSHMQTNAEIYHYRILEANTELMRLPLQPGIADQVAAVVQHQWS